MPELPEVETVRRGLSPVMEQAVIARADVHRPDLRWPFPPRMAQRLTGAKVLQLRRRSKYILADLSSEETLLIHLGMSGRMQISGHHVGEVYIEHPELQKHDHVVLHFETGARVTFNDARRFGAMDLFVTAEEEQQTLLSKLGPEPFGNDFNAAYLYGELQRRRSAIKIALLDQRVVSGLGNIYVCEVLYQLGLHPKLRACDVSKVQCERLVVAIREVLIKAIDAGGSTLKDHRTADGSLGYFQHQFQVYGREGQPCYGQHCDYDVQRLSQAGRSSFFCPNCQPIEGIEY